MNKKIISVCIIVFAFVLIASGVGIMLYSKKDNIKINNNDDVTLTNTTKDDENIVESFDKNDRPKDSNSYKKNEDGSFVNTSKKVLGNHTKGDFVISNMTISTDGSNNELAKYHYTLKNNGDKNYDTIDISLVFTFSDGSKSTEMVSVANNLGAGASVEVESSSLMRIIDAVDYSFQYKDSNSLGVG